MFLTLYLADFFIFTVFSSDSTLSIYVVSSDQCVSLSKTGYIYVPRFEISYHSISHADEAAGG